MDSRTALARAITAYVELENEHRTRYRTLLAALMAYLEDNYTSANQLAKGVSWLEFREAFERRIDVGESLLELLHHTGIHIRDARPECDTRSMTVNQLNALRVLDVTYSDGMTFSEASQAIIDAQRGAKRDKVAAIQGKPHPRTRAKVHSKRDRHL